MQYGTGNYAFFVTVNDNAIAGTTDNFRIKIWDKVTSSVIYDTQPGDSDTADATNPIDVGNIAIH